MTQSGFLEVHISWRTGIMNFNNIELIIANKSLFDHRYFQWNCFQIRLVLEEFRAKNSNEQTTYFCNAVCSPLVLVCMQTICRVWKIKDWFRWEVSELRTRVDRSLDRAARFIPIR